MDEREKSKISKFGETAEKVFESMRTSRGEVESFQKSI